MLAPRRWVRWLLARHCAKQAKVIGDGVMLRCDDPGAAVRLGLELVDEPDGELPPVRVGIHTGPALANDGDWYGTTVNVAARLCAVAPGGEVMVSEATRQAAGDLEQIDWGTRELHWLRNVSEPVATFLVSCPPAATPPVLGWAATGRIRRAASLLAGVCPRQAAREVPA